MSLLLQNDSGGAVVPFVTGCHPSGPMLVVVVKRVFHLAPGKPLTPIEPPPPPAGCTFVGDDPNGECLSDSELAPFKPQTDVLLTGSCHVPHGRALPALVAGFSVGALTRRIAVFGDRTWKKGLFSTGASDPKPFTMMPLTWSRAYGGPTWRDNPVGCGRDSNHLPNLEHPERLLAKPKSPQPPAGVGPINPLWHARASRLGTFPADWLKKHAPAYPNDFDWSYFNAAPGEQRLSGHLRGDETCSFTHLHPAVAEWSTCLPGLSMRIAVEDDENAGRRRTQALVLDTLHADTERGTLTLLWRGWLPVRGRDLGCVRRLVVAVEALNAPITTATLLAHLAAIPTPPPPMPAPVEPPLAHEVSVPPIDWRARIAPGADLSNAPLAGLDLTGQDLSGCNLTETDLRGACLRRARLDHALLIGARLEGADLTDATLVAADCTGADFTRAVLDRAVFDDARLGGARCEGAWLRRASLARVYGAGMIFDRIRGDGLKAHDALCAGASFAGAVLDEADFTGSDLSRASFVHATARRLIASRARLSNARLINSDFSGARLNHLQAAASCWQHVRLEHVDFSEGDLPGAVFPQAVLTHARLIACDLTDALFVGADLQRADLSGSKCLHTSFHQADCRNAVFTGALCFEADFTECATTGANFAGVDVTRTVLA
ncbi:MAG TPA: DUF2169 domain-containing protein [Planctomycetota bacterium]|nr:DUF2169 domain-containing protein [Planctomycetota bacterium]